MSVFDRQEKIKVRMGLQFDPIDLTKTRLSLLLWFAEIAGGIRFESTLDIS